MDDEYSKIYSRVEVSAMVWRLMKRLRGARDTAYKLGIPLYLLIRILDNQCEPGKAILDYFGLRKIYENSYVSALGE